MRSNEEVDLALGREPRPKWAGIGLRQNIELGIGIACGFAIVSALGAFILWIVRQFG